MNKIIFPYVGEFASSFIYDKIIYLNIVKEHQEQIRKDLDVFKKKKKKKKKKK